MGRPRKHCAATDRAAGWLTTLAAERQVTHTGAVVRLTVIALAFLAQIAQAQPGMTPAQLQPQSPSPSVMDRRWSVSLAIGSQGFEQKDEGVSKIDMGVLDVGARFRIRPAIEVGLGLVLGGTDDPAEASTGGLFADFRYRFLAERRWNIYAGVGLGVVSLASKDATEDAKKGRGAFRLGVGLERRFRAFAIHADLRFIRVAQNKDLPRPEFPDPTWQFSRYGLAGASLSVGGALYF